MVLSQTGQNRKRKSTKYPSSISEFRKCIWTLPFMQYILHMYSCSTQYIHLTYSTFYIENFNCTQLVSEGIYCLFQLHIKLQEKLKKKNLQENSGAVNFENLKGTTEQDTEKFKSYRTFLPIQAHFQVIALLPGTYE